MLEPIRERLKIGVVCRAREGFYFIKEFSFVLSALLVDGCVLAVFEQAMLEDGFLALRSRR